MQVLRVPSLKCFVRPVLLALFIAGCGDGPVDPVLPVSVSLTPAGPISLYVGDTVTVHATVLHGASDAVSYGTSNGAVASVSSTGLVTAIGTGTASITATSVSDPSRSASVQLQVQPPASLLIEQVLNATGTQPLDPSSVRGLIFVQLAVERANATRLEVLVDSVAVTCQSFSSAAASPGSSSLRCGFNTAAFDSVSGIPLLHNGTARVSARLIGPDERVLQTVQGQQIVLANSNALVTRVSASRQALDASGLRWIDGDVTITALPVLFDASATLSQVAFSYRSPAGVTTLVADTAAPFTATFKEDEELEAITDTTFEVAIRSAMGSGTSGPGGTTTAVRYDNQAPIPGVLVARPWFGAIVPFAVSYDNTGEKDAGVGRNVANFFAGDPVLTAEELVEQGKPVVRGGDLPRALYNSYRLAANVCDALENCTVIPGFTFGIDVDPPILDRVTIADSAVNPGADLTIGIQDDLSGIGRYGMLVTSTRFDTRAPLPVCGPIVEGEDLPGHLDEQLCVPDSLGFTAPVPRSAAGYYEYTITPLDQAGNEARAIRRRILVDVEKPVVSGVVVPQQLVPGEEMAPQITATDNLDLVRIGARLVFPNEYRTGTLSFPFVSDSVVGRSFDFDLNTAATATRRFPFVRSLTYAASGTATTRATVIVDSLQIRATDAAGLEAIADRLVSRSAFGNDTSTLDPFPTLSSVTSSVDRVLVCSAGCRDNDPTSLSVSIRVIDESTTGGLPFARVYFFRRGASERISLLGSSITSQTVQGTQRTVTYSFPYQPETGLTGSYALFAVGVKSTGVAMVTEYRPTASNTVQFFTREP